jgi:hypothetical protein
VLSWKVCEGIHKTGIKKSLQVQWLLTVILATWEAELGRDRGSRQAWAKSLQDPISTNKTWALWCVPSIPTT